MKIDPTTALPSDNGLDLEDLHLIAKENEDKFKKGYMECINPMSVTDEEYAAYEMRVRRHEDLCRAWEEVRRSLGATIDGYESLKEELEKCK